MTMPGDQTNRSTGMRGDARDGAAAGELPATTIATDAPAPVQTEPVRILTPVRVGRRSGVRWAIASIVTVLVLVVSAAGLMLLSAGAPTSTLVSYVPADSVGYLEIRLDAPGDQRQNAANLLSHFPGFADQSTLGTKLNEALDQLVGRATGGKQTFTGNIKSWLGDSLAIALTRLPAMPSATAPLSGAAPGQEAGLLLVNVKDPAAARSWAEATFGPGTASETYAGISLTSFERHGMTAQFGVVANVLLIGDATSVHAAIDSKGAGTFAETASFKAAAAAAPGDRLAFGFLDVRRVADAVGASRPQIVAATATSLDQLPAWLSVTVRAESDSLSATIALPPTNLTPVTSNHASVLATRLPAGTVAAGEIHDLAALLGSITTALRSSPGTQGGQNQIDQALQALGGIDALVGWMGDASVAVIRTDGAADLAGGLVIQAKDAGAASTKLLQLKNLVALVGGGYGITLKEEDYNGTSIAIIDAGEASQITGGAPVPGVSPGARLLIAVAQKDDLVIAGVGVAFVKAVLDTKPGSSLADQVEYKNALDRAGVSNTGQLYVDLRTVLDIASRYLPADSAQRYEADIKPYLAPFRAFAASGSAGDPNRARLVITVK
jgi:hypothetical protein